MTRQEPQCSPRGLLFSREFPFLFLKPMTKTYAQLVKQIESLQGEADKLRRKEVEGVISRIRDAITVYGLTAADLPALPAGARWALDLVEVPGRMRGALTAKRGYSSVDASASAAVTPAPAG